MPAQEVSNTEEDGIKQWQSEANLCEPGNNTGDESTTVLFEDGMVFTESYRLRVDVKGIGAIRIPVPMTQKMILVYDMNDSLAYMSVRSSIWSGSSILSSPKRGHLITTEHNLGRCPQLRLLQPVDEVDRIEPIAVTSKLTSRAAHFTVRGSACLFEWRYIKKKCANGKTHNVLALQMKDPILRRTTVAAHLVRDEGTRTAGSSRFTAGNGGELAISAELNPELIDEALLIATCLIMLRKERDRRRLIQTIVIIH